MSLLLLMRFRIVPIVLLSILYQYSLAEIIPKDGTGINHTDVYFEEEQVLNATDYLLELYCDTSHTGKEQFLLATVKSPIPVFWTSNLLWNARYEWRVKAKDGNGQIINQSATHFFSTVPLKIRSSLEYKVNVITNDKDRNAGGYIVVDHLRAIIDRSGRTVWTLPDMPELVTDRTQLRDMRVTKDNTITFISDSSIAEITMDGEIVWKVLYPYIFMGDTIEFHHDFRKTDWGTYLVLGNKIVSKPVATSSNKLSNGGLAKDNFNYRKSRVGMAMEFDKAGNVIWSWDSEKYLRDEDLYFKESNNITAHMNALGVDKDNTTIFLGFRNLSRIIKINKATGNVENSWGEKYPSNQVHHEVDFFQYQHDATLSSNNAILILDNGERSSKISSKVVEFKQDFGPGENPVLWSFSLKFDSLSDGKSARGGNVVELPNGNRLICGGELNRIIEVTHDKKVVWDAFLTSLNPKSKRKNNTWVDFDQYRANWIKELKEYHFWISNVTQEKKAIMFKLTNTGNAKDHYTVSAYDAKGEKTQEIETKVIARGETVNVRMNIKNYESDLIKILVTSTSDKRISKSSILKAKN